MTARVIGITSTIPVEIIYAAGAVALDLNNVFITAERPLELVECAEGAGFARNYCAWMKGIFGALHQTTEINEVIGVVQGDCANTAALLDLLRHRGFTTREFAYPGRGDTAGMRRAIDKLAGEIGADTAAVERWRCRLNEVRALALEIDRMTWQDNKISGEENHLALVNTSDFKSDPDAYELALRDLISTSSARTPFPGGVRLGLVGVPPITGDIYAKTEEMGARVVYNEVQREFAMPRPTGSLTTQYLDYGYPYGAGFRAPRIAGEAAARGVDGLVHYVQSFCYHQLDDIIIREIAGLPVLTLEADKPGPLDARNRLRLEAFLETLRETKR